jgi:PAS domain S-box-containing protein
VSEIPAGSVDPRAFSGRRFGPMRFLLPPTLGWVLLAYAALVLASVISYSTLRVRMDREQTLQTERNRLRAVAAVLETGTLAMLSDGVGSAVAGANEIESSGGLDASSDTALSSSLRKLMTGGNYVRSIFLADGQRFVRAGRNGSYESLSSPPAWMTALTSPPTAEQTWVGRPIPDPDQPGATAAQASSPTVIPVARLIQTGRGRRVWAGALLNFDALDALHGQPGTGTTALGLVSSDGTVLVRVAGLVSTRVQVGDNAAGNVLFRQMTTSGADSGTVEGLSPFFATQMIFAYARVNGYPMMMVTCESMATALAPWRDRTTTTVLVTTVLSILVVLMTWLLNHSVRAFFSRESHFRALSNNAAFGVLMLEGDRFVDANDTIARMFGLENRDATLGRTPWELSPERQPDGSLSKDAAHQRIAEGLRQGATSFEWTHKRLDTGESFPAEVDLTSLRTGRTTLTLAVVHDLTERKQAEQQLKESEHRYRALVDSLPEAVFVHRGAELLFVNEAGVKLVGARSSSEIVGRPIVSFVSEEDRANVIARARQVLEQGAPIASWEARILRVDGSFIWVESEGVPIKFGGAPAVQGVMRDITARRRREAAEAARTDRMQRQSAALMRLANRYDCGWTDLEACLRSICATAAEVLGVDRVGVWLLDGESFRCAELFERATRRHSGGSVLAAGRFSRFLEALRTQRVIEASDVRVDSRLQEIAAGQWLAPVPTSIIAAAVRSSGDLSGVVCFDQMGAPRPWHLDEVSFAGGVADQIAQALLDWERERVLGDLRTLAGELMRIQDEERRRVGRDLHDSTGQTLAALELDLARLMESAKTLPPAQRELLAECARLASVCSAEIRTASYLLHPPLLDELGLVSALRWLADGLRNRGGIDVRLDLPESMSRLRPDEELTLFRIAQEALTNAQRHSASPWVSLRLKRNGNSVDLEVEDGGRGIPLRDDPRGAPILGVGLAGMRERMRQIGGTFAVESTGSGTRIRASIVVNAVPRARSA